MERVKQALAKHPKPQYPAEATKSKSLTAKFSIPERANVLRRTYPEPTSNGSVRLGTAFAEAEQSRSSAQTQYDVQPFYQRMISSPWPSWDLEEDAQPGSRVVDFPAQGSPMAAEAAFNQTTECRTSKKSEYAPAVERPPKPFAAFAEEQSGRWPELITETTQRELTLQAVARELRRAERLDREQRGH